MTETKFIAEAGKSQIITKAVFEAPIAKVFDAVTNPQLFPLWIGPNGLTTTIEIMDLRKGGTYRFIQSDAEQHEYTFNGVYHEVTSPKRFIYTFEYEGAPGHVVLNDVIFEESGGKTTMTETSAYLSVEDRDAMLQDGMEKGVMESMQRLARLVENSNKATKGIT